MEMILNQNLSEIKFKLSQKYNEKLIKVKWTSKCQLLAGPFYSLKYITLMREKS